MLSRFVFPFFIFVLTFFAFWASITCLALGFIASVYNLISSFAVMGCFVSRLFAEETKTKRRPRSRRALRNEGLVIRSFFVRSFIVRLHLFFAPLCNFLIITLAVDLKLPLLRLWGFQRCRYPRRLPRISRHFQPVHRRFGL